MVLRRIAVASSLISGVLAESELPEEEKAPADYPKISLKNSDMVFTPVKHAPSGRIPKPGKLQSTVYIVNCVRLLFCFRHSARTRASSSAIRLPE